MVTQGLELNLHASFCVSELDMIVHQVLLIPRIFLHPFVVFDALEHDLTKAVKVG